MRSHLLVVASLVVLSAPVARVEAFSMGEGMATTGVQGTVGGNATGGGVVGATKQVRTGMPSIAASVPDIDDGGSGMAANARKRPGGGGSGATASAGGSGSSARWTAGSGNWSTGTWTGSGGGGGSWSAGAGWAGGGGWSGGGGSSGR